MRLLPGHDRSARAHAGLAGTGAEKAGRRPSPEPSILLAGLYLVIGFASITLVTALREALHFGPAQIAVITSCSVGASIFTPFIVAIVEYKMACRERGLAALFAMNAALTVTLAASIGAFSSIAAQHRTAATVIIAVLVSAVALGVSAAAAIANAYVLKALGQAERFGHVRSAGTAAFACAGVLTGLAFRPGSTGPFYLASATSLVMVAVSLKLPPQAVAFARIGTAARTDRFGLAATNIAGVLLVAMMTSLIEKFYSVYGNAFVASFDVRSATTVQMLALTVEFWLVRSIGTRASRGSTGHWLVLGPAAWTLLFALWALSSKANNYFTMMIALPLQGFNCAAGVAVATHVERKARSESKGVAQGWVGAAQSAGGLAGALIVGLVAPERQRRRGVGRNLDARGRPCSHGDGIVGADQRQFHRRRRKSSGSRCGR